MGHFNYEKNIFLFIKILHTFTIVTFLIQNRLIETFFCYSATEYTPL